MNEKSQIKCVDDLVNACPLFNDYISEFTNFVFKRGKNHLGDVDKAYVFDSYVVLFEYKTRDSCACHKKMESQMKKYKKFKNLIFRQMGVNVDLPVYYFYAHFENDVAHIEYEGMRK